VPSALAAAVDAEALAADAAASGPFLGQGAAVGDDLDPALAGLARWSEYLALADPEIELAMPGRLARLGRRRLRPCARRGHREQRRATAPLGDRSEGGNARPRAEVPWPHSCLLRGAVERRRLSPSPDAERAAHTTSHATADLQPSR
jgi:hypothetical protein